MVRGSGREEKEEPVVVVRVAVNGIGANVGERPCRAESSKSEKSWKRVPGAQTVGPRFGDREKCVGVETDFPCGWWWWIPLVWVFACGRSRRCGAGGGVSLKRYLAFF